MGLHVSCFKFKIRGLVFFGLFNIFLKKTQQKMEENKGNLFQNLSKFLFKKNSQQPPLI